MFRIRIDINESEPIYLQLMDAVKKGLVRGEIAPGEKLPSLRDLAAAARVNPNTVQHAYQELEREGVIFSRRGQGSFATESASRIAEMREELASQAVRRFVAEMNALGFGGPEIMDRLRAALPVQPGAGRGQPLRAQDQLPRGRAADERRED